MDDFSIREFMKRYSNTYLILKDAKTSKLKSCFLRDLLEEDDTAYFVFEGFNLEVTKINVYEVPFRKCFNTGEGVAVFSRLPVRQFKKGFNPENTSLLNGMHVIVNSIDNNIAERTTRSNIRFSAEVFQDMVDTSYTYSIHLSATSKRVQTCITDTYWLSKTFKDNEFVVFRYDVPVGSYNVVTDEITPITDVYQQELFDLVNRLNLQTKVN
jgi:hypothetical protein